MIAAKWTARLLAPALAFTLTACAPDPPDAVVGVWAEGCGPKRSTGTGAFMADGLVLTAAHTVAGAEVVTVVRDGVAQPAEIAAFDPDMDLAVLRTADPTHHRLPYSVQPPSAGTAAIAYVVRERPEALPVEIVRSVEISTTDLYGEGHTLRPGYELAGDIEPGDSGAPVLVDGAVVGVIWARSNLAQGRGYAIDPIAAGARLRQQLAAGDLGDAEPTRCDR